MKNNKIFNYSLVEKKESFIPYLAPLSSVFDKETLKMSQNRHSL